MEGITTTNQDTTDDDLPGEHDQWWRRAALCKGGDPAIWFPASSAPGTEAKAVCALCPVRQDCLQAAILDGEEDGIWGGAGEMVRRHLARLLHASPHPGRVFQSPCNCLFHRAWKAHWLSLDTLRHTGQRAVGQVNRNGKGAHHGKASSRARGCSCLACRHSRTKPGCDCTACQVARRTWPEAVS